VIDGNRVYQLENASRLKAFDLETGRELWAKPLGTSQKAPLVFADGKLFVGSESGKFFIVRPSADSAEIISEVELPISKDSVQQQEGTPEPVLAGAAISRGRVFFVSSDAIYAIGPKTAKSLPGTVVDQPIEKGEGAPAFLQVSPTELVLKPGQTIKLRAKSFDGKGRFLRDETAASWSLQGLKGTVAPDGSFTVGADPTEQAGTIKATVGPISGEARARVVHPLPWTETFDSYADGAVPAGWINAVAGKFSVTTLDGQKVLQKAPDNTIFKRLRAFIGPTDWANYTFEADVRGTTRRRQMSDIGITVQRYSLVLYGNAQQLKIEPWEPETQRTVKTAFAWKADTWYHLKLRVENLADGKVRALGKAWPAGETEPAQWTIEKIDPIGNRQGAPGLFVDAEFGAYLDNLKIVMNQ